MMHFKLRKPTFAKADYYTQQNLHINVSQVVEFLVLIFLYYLIIILCMTCFYFLVTLWVSIYCLQNLCDTMKTITTGKFIAKFYYIEKSTRLHRTNTMMQKPNDQI